MSGFFSIIPVNSKQMLVYSLLTEKLGISGRMISGSKSGYRERFPDNLAIFNANVCVEGKKIWYGDIDVTQSAEDLKEIAIKSGETIHILYEMDARFEFENDPQIKNAAVTIRPDGTIVLSERLKDIYSF